MPHSAGRGGVSLDDVEARELGKRHDEITLPLDERALRKRILVIVREAQRHGKLLTRAYAICGARRTHRGNKLHDKLDCLLGLVVNPAREVAGIGPGRHHEGGGVILDRQVFPNSLSHERHDRVEQAQGAVEHEDEIALGDQTGLPVLGQARLAKLDIPIAELVPEKRVELARDIAKAILLDAGRDRSGELGETREDPRIGGRRRLGLARLVAIHVEHDEARRVPDLGDEGPRGFGTRGIDELVGLLVDVGIELDVLVVGDEREQVEAHRIGRHTWR